MKRRSIYRTLIGTMVLCIVALTVVSCSVSLHGSTGYSTDSMYGTHSQSQIEKDKAQRAAAQQREKEERMAQWANILGVTEQPTASQHSYQDVSEMSEMYNTPYGARLLALSSGGSVSEYQKPESYYNYVSEQTLEELAQYDPAEYDASISSSGVLVIEPKYSASIYGSWSDTPYYYNYAWNYGYPTWRYNYVWGYPRFAWNPWSYRYYDPWYDFYPYSFYYSYYSPYYYPFYRPYYRPINNHRPSYSHKNPVQKPIVRPSSSSSVSSNRFNSNGSNVGSSTSTRSSSYNRSASGSSNRSSSSSSYSSSSSRSSSSSSSSRSSSSSTRSSSLSSPSRSSGSSSSGSSRGNSFGR